MQKLMLSIIIFFLSIQSYAQPRLTLVQQKEEFQIFTTSLKEMHAGLHWFITPERFTTMTDSVNKTLQDNETVESFYLKLRYCMASLHHGHGGIHNTQKEQGISYKLYQMPKTKKHLPFVLRYLNGKLFIVHNSSTNKKIPNGSELLSINGRLVSDLTTQFMQYIFANGNNVTYKYEQLTQYFGFHYLYQALYTRDTTYTVTIQPYKQAKKITTTVKGIVPQELSDNYTKLKGNDVNKFGELLQYKVLDKNKKTAYLKLETFSTYRTDNDTFKIVQWLEKTFAQIKLDKIQHLIIDIRNNEGGDDTWQTAASYFKGLGENKNAGLSYLQSDKYTQAKYIIRNNENNMLLMAFEKNPYALIDKTEDGRYKLKPQYVQHDTRAWPLQKNAFNGKVYLLQNGLTFSAGFAFAGRLRYLMDKDSSYLKVIGEDYGDDLAAGVGSGGWSLDVQLPYSKIIMNIPITGGGDKPYTIKPVKMLDYRVIPTITDVMNGVDTEVEFAKKLMENKIK